MFIIKIKLFLLKMFHVIWSDYNGMHKKDYFKKQQEKFLLIWKRNFCRKQIQLDVVQKVQKFIKKFFLTKKLLIHIGKNVQVFPFSIPLVNDVRLSPSIKKRLSRSNNFLTWLTLLTLQCEKNSFTVTSLYSIFLGVQSWAMMWNYEGIFCGCCCGPQSK